MAMNRHFKTLVSLIPVVSLLLTALSTNYYYYYNDQYLKVYDLISFTNGFSVFSLIPLTFVVYRFKFCLYSKLAVIGLWGYVLINLFYFFANIFGYKPTYYDLAFEAFTISTLSFLSLVYLARSSNIVFKWRN